MRWVYEQRHTTSNNHIVPRIERAVLVHTVFDNETGRTHHGGQGDTPRQDANSVGGVHKQGRDRTARERQLYIAL